MFSDELLKTLAEDGGQSNGPPVIQACDFIFLRYGHNGGFFEACGNHRQREGQIENICKNPNTFCVCLLLFFVKDCFLDQFSLSTNLLTIFVCACCFL